MILCGIPYAFKELLTGSLIDRIELNVQEYDKNVYL